MSDPHAPVAGGRRRAGLRTGRIETRRCRRKVLTLPLELASLAMVVAAAFVAGFTTGFAGFGTGLVASGLWLHVLPAAGVPPLVALSSVAAQIVGLVGVRKAFDWPRARPFLAGGAIGVPIGVATLAAASPFLLKAVIGGFLVVYAAARLLPGGGPSVGDRGGWPADAAIGIGGGFLGGFAGLSGPLPIVWLQMRGGDAGRQRAVYQPFNLVVLVLASLAMAAAGRITRDVLWIAALCLPATLLGATIGARVYAGVSPMMFERAVLALLLASGSVLLVQAFG